MGKKECENCEEFSDEKENEYRQKYFVLDFQDEKINYLLRTIFNHFSGCHLLLGVMFLVSILLNLVIIFKLERM